MPRNLGSQYQAIPSPWADHEVFSFPDASQIGEADRPSLMDAMNNIIAVNWKATEPHWTASSSPFASQYSLILVCGRSGLLAFSVYRMLNVAGHAAVYRSGTEVLPAHQGRGLYGLFTAEILKRTAAANPGKASILYGWRTRNPIVWASNAKICEKVAPSLLGDPQDPALQATGVEMCSSLYPGKALEVPSMVMRGAYGHIKHHRQAYHGAAALVDAALTRIIPDSADALFSVGLARI
jgi:hypothetical protein